MKATIKQVFDNQPSTQAIRYLRRVAHIFRIPTADARVSLRGQKGLRVIQDIPEGTPCPSTSRVMYAKEYLDIMYAVPPQHFQHK